MIQKNNKIAEIPYKNLKNGINYIDDSTVILIFFAPNKKSVHLVGDFNDWTISEGFRMFQTQLGSLFWLEIKHLEKGKEYAFQYIIDKSIAVGDPYCEKILDPQFDSSIPNENYPNLKPYPVQNTFGGIVSILQTAQPEFSWKKHDFRRPTKENLVIYELLIRDFLYSRRFRDVADSLNYFKTLGINAIELMPINEFSANESWGYNPTYYFAPDKAYGTKDDLKYLIDKCHSNGIAVILDIVFNHADYDFPYVKAYWAGSLPSKDSPFFNQRATHPYSVFYDFNHESEATQNYFDAVLEFWLKEYKIDGFRFDLSKGFTQKVSKKDVDLWSKHDSKRIILLKRFYDKIRSIDKDCYVILEHFAENTEELELANYGFMIWGNLNSEFRNLGKGKKANLDWLNYKNRGWNEPNIVGYMESHDEERLMYEMISHGKIKRHYNIQKLEKAIERMQAMAAIFFSYPGPKMIWQFGEFAYDLSINHNGRVGNKPVKWEYLQEPMRLKLFKVYSELIKLKTNAIIFGSNDFQEFSSDSIKITKVKKNEMIMYVVANLDTETQTIEIEFDEGSWFDYFTGYEFVFNQKKQKIELTAGEFHLISNKKLLLPEQGLTNWQLTIK